VKDHKILFKGRAWLFGDGISTDHIAPGRYFHLRSNLGELAKHVLEDAREDFAMNVQPGDIVVGGRNFGQGSSREHAPTVIKLAGVSVVVAASIARIFFRNCINVGLPVVICDISDIMEGDILTVDLGNGLIENVTRGVKIKFSPLPPVMTRILMDGGLVPHILKHGDFSLGE
jgi:3-isopropylmalate/(R)-2-methylmalate dehydratase small subunit